MGERPTEAVACFDRILQARPDDGSAWLAKGIALLLSGDQAPAISCLRRAKELGIPVASQILDGQVSSLDGVLNAAASDSRLEAAREAASALLLATTGRPEQAVNHFDRALKATGGDAATWFNKGRALLELQRFSEALQCLDRAMEMDPNDPEIWINRGSALGGLARHDEELASYNRAIELNPHYVNAWFNKSIVLVTMGRFSDALQSLDALLQLDPGDAVAWFNKAMLLSNELGDFRAAMACFTKANQLGHPQAGAAIQWCKRMLSSPESHGR